MSWRSLPDTKDKIFSALVYLFAIYDVLPFGMSLFQQFPDLRQVISFLILPVALIYGLLPFGAFIVFLLLFFAVVRNDRISHFIRFNTMQTILIGILLSLLQLVVFRIIFPGFGSGLFVQTLCNTIFLGGIAACFYSMFQSALGQYAEIPTISNAAHSQVRY